eukprot:gene3235-6403_t
MKFGFLFCGLCLSIINHVDAFFGFSKSKISSSFAIDPSSCFVKSPLSMTMTESPEVSAKTVTKEIMSFFATPTSDQKKSLAFKKRLTEDELRPHLDGMHMIIILFQSARSRRLAKTVIPADIMLAKLKSWDREWSERDISTFVYGVRSLDCIDPIDGEILTLGAEKIAASKAQMSSRAIGNALYGLQDITSDTPGAPQLCAALADKVINFEGDLNGQDIGIGLYGLQGMSSDIAEVRQLISVLGDKVTSSETELDSQALGNALYGLQSLRSEEPSVRKLVAALASKVSESQSSMVAQTIGSGLYGMQRLSSESLEVRSLVSALAEKVESSDFEFDAQAIGNALFGLQRMKSNVPEVRALLQAITVKLSQLDSTKQMDSKGIGAALYGLQGMSSELPQVRSLLSVLAQRISLSSNCFLSGQGIADSLYGLSSMSFDCPELRSLLTALGSRIDATVGKLDSQEIGNALYGLQSLSSEMQEARVIASKLAEKVRRSKAILRSQHIGRAMLGLQKFSAESPEVKYLLKQLTKRIAESDRTRLTSSAITDSVFGLQSMTSDIPEVQELVGEIAKKIATTAAELSPVQIGKILFGLQSFTSAGGLFEDSAIGLESDELQFLLSAIWDKVKVSQDQMPLSAIAMGLQGLTRLRDPIANNLRQFLYAQAIRLGNTGDMGLPLRTPTGSIQQGQVQVQVENNSGASSSSSSITAESLSIYQARQIGLDRIDIVSTVRAMRLNDLKIPRWLATEYIAIERAQLSAPIPLSRADKLVLQKYQTLFPMVKLIPNSLIDGFRLDMNFPDIKLNIELDGPKHRHPARARFDMSRDDYLRKKGYQVERLQLFGKSVDEMVAAISAIVQVRKEIVADKEIQQIYARVSD